MRKFQLDAKKGIKKQYLVTSDGDYAETVKELKKRGCALLNYSTDM